MNLLCVYLVKTRFLGNINSCLRKADVRYGGVSWISIKDTQDMKLRKINIEALNDLRTKSLWMMKGKLLLTPQHSGKIT